MNTISVIIPLYNKGPHIKRTIKSLLNQTKKPDEIIIIDDGSTDNGGELVKKIKSPLIKYLRQENRGEWKTRNRGIKIANGDIIAFLDADDTWEPNYLYTIQELINHYPMAGAYATAYYIILPNGIKIKKELNILDKNKEFGVINYIRSALKFPVWICATAFHKKILIELGGFYEGNINGIDPFGGDVDLILRIAMHHPIVWSSKPLATYHQDATNRTVGFRRWSGEPVISRTARLAIEAGIVPPEQIKDLREYAAHFQISAARDCLVLGKKEKAKELLEYARGTKKFARQWWQYRLLAACPGNPGPYLWKVKQLTKIFRGNHGI